MKKKNINLNPIIVETNFLLFYFKIIECGIFFFNLNQNRMEN